LTNRL